MTILENLYNGNINPCELEKLHKRCEYKTAVSHVNITRDKLDEILTEEQKEVFEEYITQWDEMSSIVEEEIFKTGFSLGLRIAAESLYD
jgi:hypothetical protein